MAEPITQTVKKLEARVEAMQFLIDLLMVKRLQEEESPLEVIANLRETIDIEAEQRGPKQPSAIVLRQIFARYETAF